MNPYRGRIAPTPTGYLHLGHARTFWKAQQRAQENGGVLILRNEDLDFVRCKKEFVSSMFEDLRWFGFRWQEGPDIGGNFASYNQSERLPFYRAVFEKLRAGNFIYRCNCSRKDILRSSQAPHAEDEEPIYPGTCRGNVESGIGSDESQNAYLENSTRENSHLKFNWRFRVPDGELISFHDENFGRQQFLAGKDFGDFIVWRHDGIPSYQLAVVTDDAAMKISEVVRGADLLLSTARQILLYRALGFAVPKFYHCELMTDSSGVRLAKRNQALSLKALRENGISPEKLRALDFEFLQRQARV